MAAGEFELIRRHFARRAPAGMLGVGDDCALLPAMPGAMAVSTDLLIEGRHFFSDVDPEALGHKALAVNLSDLAAMGAAPRAFVLALALPGCDDAWLAAFARGLFALADAHACPLVGGDTTRGTGGITLGVTVFGEVDPSQALRRDAARAGDDVWVSGALGAADIALRLLDGRLDRPADGAALLAATRGALERPQPRVALGQALRSVAHAAIDLSDGLLQDLGHILAASDCGAVLDVDALPLAGALAGLPSALVREAALVGGDVYELCFTAPAASRAAVAAAGASAGVPVARVGRIESGAGLRLADSEGRPLPLPERRGFDHFAG